jgi:2-polyprenyl-3-methyl-5-hydroxy-6-metoxy-1,4-benzoquinol methylase
MGRLAYLGRSLASQLNRRRYRCRNCESDRSQLIERKYLITHLRRCECCKLMFRTPTDDPASSQAFYETKYAQGVTTRTPSDVELDSLKGISFRGSELDYSYYVSILSALGLQDGAKLFDFGCSWGYGSYQLTCAGFDVTAFEIASIRANFARRKLNVRLIDNMGFAASDPAQKTQFDCFFSAHVLEHTPAPSQIFGYAMSMLRPGGLFVAFTPNGSSAFRNASSSWSKLWGEVHPNFIDDLFFDLHFAHSPRSLASSPARSVALPDIPKLKRLDILKGSELLFVARKVGDAW